MTKEKVIKKLQKMGFSEEKSNEMYNDLIKEDDPTTDTQNVDATPKQVDEPKKAENVPNVADTPKVDEGKKEDTKVSDVKPASNYEEQIKNLTKGLEDLKALLNGQQAKVDKSYEILQAQGKAPIDTPLGVDTATNIASSQQGISYADLLNGKK